MIDMVLNGLVWIKWIGIEFRGMVGY